MASETTGAPDLKPFNNWITMLILIAIVLSALITVTLAFVGKLGAAIVYGGIWVFIASKGRTVHGTDDPVEAGILYFWDTPIKRKNDEPIVVGGSPFLLPFFPFYLKSVKINTEVKEKTFTINVKTTLNGKPIIVALKVQVNARPDLLDALDFIRYGKSMEEVFNSLEGVVSVMVQELITHEKMTLEEILDDPARIRENILASFNGGDHGPANGSLDESSFGIHVENVRIKTELPKSILEAIEQSASEGYQRDGELQDYQTTDIAARNLLLEHASVQHPGINGLDRVEQDRILKKLTEEKKIPALWQCREAIMEQKRINAGLSQSVAGTGGKGGAVPVVTIPTSGKKGGNP